MLTSEYPDQCHVLSENSTTPQPAIQKNCSPIPLSLTPKEEEQIKFAIGLRLLGEKKRARFLVFMETLRERREGTTHGI